MDEKHESIELVVVITPLYKDIETQTPKELADDIASHVSNNYRVAVTVLYEGGRVTKEW